MLANGTDAVASTMPMISRKDTQPGAASTEPTTDGAPKLTSAPPTRATSPAAMAGVTNGTTSRFTAGEINASRPNDARTTGSVAACAASDTPRLSASQRGSRPRDSRSSRAVKGVAQATSPAVASVDSWKPASITSAGSASSSRNAASPSAAAARPLRPDSRASRTTPAIAPARRTDGEAPAKTMYATTAMAVTTARRRRPSRPAIAPTAAATMAMFQPEIATT